MDNKKYVMVTGCIFLLISLLHLARVILEWEAIIGGWVVPSWISWATVVVAGFFAYTAFTFNKQG